MNEYKLIFTAADMQVLQAALVEMPFRIAAPLMNKINEQIQAAHDPNVDVGVDGNTASDRRMDQQLRP